jgi:hypothetical protein
MSQLNTTRLKLIDKFELWSIFYHGEHEVEKFVAPLQLLRSVKKFHIRCEMIWTNVYKQVTIFTLQVDFVTMSKTHTQL